MWPFLFIYIYTHIFSQNREISFCESNSIIKMSIITKTFVLAFLTLAHCMRLASAQACIGSFDALRALEVARGNNNSVPVTYVICPNTVFDMSALPEDVAFWEMNGNTNYLCGEKGSSESNCTVTGGEVQAAIIYFPFEFSSKENILVQGFTFEKSSLISVAIASEGEHTFRDCIFRVSVTLRNEWFFFNCPYWSGSSRRFCFILLWFTNLGLCDSFCICLYFLHRSNVAPSHSHVSGRQQVWL